MKIICEKEKLLKAINAVVRGVPTRTTMPILEGIYLQTNSNKINNNKKKKTTKKNI